MSTTLLKIATRKSPLALWQANFVKAKIEAFDRRLTVELVPLVTTADKFLNTPLTKMGGKALFVKELEQALLNHEADIAVHSMKDVPNDFPDGLGLVAILEREDPSDALVSNSVKQFAQLPEKSCVGTSSLRRQSQLLAMRPDLNIKPLRGNVNTRLAKLDNGDFDAIVLATSGLSRLSFQHRIQSTFGFEELLPAAGQGALGIEARLADKEKWPWLSELHHEMTAHCVHAERSLTQTLGGNCQVPIASFATMINRAQTQTLFLRAMVASPDGRSLIRAQGEANHDEAITLGTNVAKDLLKQGADTILTALR